MRIFLKIALIISPYTLFGQSAREAIEFINGKSNNGAHTIFSSSDEMREYSLIKFDGTVLHRIEIHKDRETKERFNPPKMSNYTSHLKYMNPFNVKVVEDSKDIFWIELNTTNSTRKVKVDYYGNLIMGKSIRLGPYRRSDEYNLEERLVKAASVAITHFGGKPDSF